MAAGVYPDDAADDQPVVSFLKGGKSTAIM